MVQVCFLLVLLCLTYFSFKSVRNSGYALAIVWSIYATEQFLQFSNPFFVRFGSLFNFAVVGIASASIFFALKNGKVRRLRVSKAHIYWGLLMLLTLMSIGWSVSSSVSFSKVRDAAPYIIGFCLIAPYCAHSKEQINKAIQATTILGGVVLFGLLFCDYGVRSVIIYSDAYTTITGNPLAVATYSGYVLICCVFSVYTNKGNVLLKLLKLATSVLAVYLIVRSSSRGQLIAVVFACLVWLPLTARVAMKRSTIVGMIFGALILGAAFYFVSGESELAWRWSTGRMQEDQGGRFEVAKFMLTENLDAGPWAWVMGLGTSASYELAGGYPHIVPLEVIAEEGILGFFLFVAFLILVSSFGFKVMKLKTLDMTSRVNIGAMMTLFTFQVVLSFKQGSLLGSPSLFGIGLCIALAAERTLALHSRRPVQNFGAFPIQSRPQAPPNVR